MNNNRTRLYAVIAGTCAALVTALGFLFFYDNSSDEYKTYVEYMERAGLPPLTENAAREDAGEVCDHFSQGLTERPFGYLDQKEIIAIVSGYCPEYTDVASWSLVLK
jgi:hypothetical protein